MAELSKAQVRDLAKAAGPRLDDLRAETIAARLPTVIQPLDELPDDPDAAPEPLPIFTVDPEDRDG